MPAKILTERALNRSYLERQLLLRRVDLPVVAAVEHLVGMQAQSPNAPYIGLWSRLDGFATEAVADAISDRRLVRANLMRGTIHLVSARDCLALYPLTQPIFARANSVGRPPADGVLATAAGLLAERPRTLAELRVLLGSAENAWAARHLLPLVHVPPKGIWGRSGQARLTTVRAWLGRDIDERGALDAVILRYLAAFGPATVKDMQTWSGLNGLREVVERLSAKLRTFHGEHGTTLYDVPDAPLPDPDTPAPVRLLPEYDNALRSHTDRRRIMTDPHRAALFATNNDAPTPAFLIDGFVRGTWKLERTRKAATLTLRPFGKLSKRDHAAARAEADRLLTFAAPDAETRTVSLVAPD